MSASAAQGASLPASSAAKKAWRQLATRFVQAAPQSEPGVRPSAAPPSQARHAAAPSAAQQAGDAPETRQAACAPRSARSWCEAQHVKGVCRGHDSSGGDCADGHVPASKR